MVQLYTLPTCPICTMVKKKLQDKGIVYEEKPFELGKGTLFDTDRAPILFADGIIYDGPAEMVAWINSQE